MIVKYAILLAAAIGSVSASVASTFTAPAAAPTDTSSFYVGASNDTINNAAFVPGKVFDRFIQIWLENTDFAQAASQAGFQNLTAQGILLNSYYGVTHPSQPNYVASVGGDFFGLADDSLTFIPTNMSTIVDLLEEKGISWSTYQENMPTDGYPGFNFTNPDNYTTALAPARIRNFNDFAVDIGNNSLSQWIFVTPNLRNDAHDTTIEYAADWLSYWLLPLLQDGRFNTDRTLILLTFDENETYSINNRVFTILLGGVIPKTLWNTTDNTFYTHYSLLSTVQNNWDLGNLGRQDTNKTVANVFSFVANTTSYQNSDVSGSSIPLLNLTGTYPGALNPDAYVPYLAPKVNSTGAGGGPTFVAPNVNLSLNASTAPAPVNLSAAAASNSSSKGDARVTARAGVQGVLGATLAIVAAGLLF
ncbi:phosphoesterase family-domain-containing protein [Chiua virens]|nr:phosphoesterase family-domain-containing protein [Chiua virens]